VNLGPTWRRPSLHPLPLLASSSLLNFWLFSSGHRPEYLVSSVLFWYQAGHCSLLAIATTRTIVAMVAPASSSPSPDQPTSCPDWACSGRYGMPFAGFFPCPSPLSLNSSCNRNVPLLYIYIVHLSWVIQADPSGLLLQPVPVAFDGKQGRVIVLHHAARVLQHGGAV
jgi:hypothetical protein